MSLIVEDGTNVPNADSYLSVADADKYHAAMGNTAWADATGPQKEIALRVGTQYIDTNYAFRGDQLFYAQSLRWPRANVYFENEYLVWPVKRVQQATAEAALRALSTPLFVDMDDKYTTEETVGPITVKYGQPRNSGQVGLTIVDRLLAPFIGAAGFRQFRVERA